MEWAYDIRNYIRHRKALTTLLLRAFNEAATELIDLIKAEFGDEVTATTEIKDGYYTIKILDTVTKITINDILYGYEERNLSIAGAHYEVVLEIVKDTIQEQITIRY